ncbi:phosphate transport system regulatory protein PhoU [Deltaproteobacteria bacterium Smac51]|nr:phosphate transport system regulatory protein PhoU [Deltaproteobacteria bacterium Smac51]
MPTAYFDKQLCRLRESLVQMGGAVEEMLDMALSALYDLDVVLAEKTIEADREINDFENKINNKTILLIATNQPVASDLRFLAGGLRVANDLERIGDISANLARRARGLARLDYKAELPPEIPVMADKVKGMISGTLASFANRNLEKAQHILDCDKEVDKLNRKVRQDILGKISQDGSLIYWGFEVINVAAHLERMGDHTTNVAEDVIYIYSGRNVRHTHSITQAVEEPAAAQALVDGNREDREDVED